jgi:hypothetical protein
MAGADLTVSRGRPLAMEIDERTSSIEPAGVMAMACTQRRLDATREAPALIAVRINWQLARDRPGRMAAERLVGPRKPGNGGGGKGPGQAVRYQVGIVWTNLSEINGKNRKTPFDMVAGAIPT